MEIPFTQYLRPNGRKNQVLIDRPDEIYAKAQRIIAAGYRFECEELLNGIVSFTISDDEDDLAGELCVNGTEVPAAVDRLITEFELTIEDPGSQCRQIGGLDHGWHAATGL